MTDVIYLEKSLRKHQRCGEILRRLPRARVIEIEHHGEVFNPKAQNFRLQKLNPALVLAKKHGNFVLPAPIGYAIGGQNNYYFSHMLNCLYDCRYCFLQGMYRSAHHTVFINYEDFVAAIEQTCEKHGDEPVWFFSGYDCDSLAYEPVTRFIDFHLPAFERIDNAHLEIRTKSTQIRQLLKHAPNPRVVVAFSFTDEATHRYSEHKVPDINRRIEAMVKLAEAGWQLGLRFDPLIHHADFEQGFNNLLQRIFARIPAEQIHSVALGIFRMPKQNFKAIHRLYPEDKLANQPFEVRNGMYSYPEDIESTMFSFCESALLSYIDTSQYFPCRW